MLVNEDSLAEITGVEMKIVMAAAIFIGLVLAQFHQALAAPTDSWKALAFLEGTWDAHTQGGSAGTQGSGTYTFKPELKHHVLVRNSSTSADCSGPKGFDCEHSDVLYIFQEAQDQPLKAIYFDSEGHVINYAVSTPDSTTAVFTSEASSCPQFQLVYQMSGTMMSGKFQMRMPGQTAWKSYLEWSGAKK
jgi:hypothetical protein